jgi:hypothetical protein
MSRTGVDSLDRSIEKTNAWLADVAASFGTADRRLAYKVTRGDAAGRPEGAGVGGAP